MNCTRDVAASGRFLRDRCTHTLPSSSFSHVRTRFLSTELLSDPPDGIAAGPIDEDNLLEWEALILYVTYYMCARYPPLPRNHRRHRNQRLT